MSQPSQRLPDQVAALGVFLRRLQLLHLISQGGVSCCGDDFLGHVKLELFHLPGAFKGMLELRIRLPTLGDLSSDLALAGDGSWLLLGWLWWLGSAPVPLEVGLGNQTIELR